MRCTILLTGILLGISSSVNAIPWPLGDGASGWESIFPVMRTYGNFDENAFWVSVDSSFDLHTFHNAIDISAAQAGTENVRTVEGGEFTWVAESSPGSGEWAVQIFPSGSSYGWHYGHVQGDDGNPLKLQDFDPNIGHTAIYGDLLGTMAEIPGKHLHFFRTNQPIFFNGNPGIDDPLDYIDAAYAPVPANGYTWEFENADPAVFFLPQRDAIYGTGSWTDYYNPPQQGGPVDPTNVLLDTLDRSALYGEIDILYCVLVKGYPQGSSVNSSGIPKKIKWSLSRYNNYPDSDGLEHYFTKYVVDFSGVLGAAPGDWQEFRRFYFPFVAHQLGFYGTGSDSKIVCLTNSSFKSAYDGISNIEENCWETNLMNGSQGTGPAPAPELAEFTDGRYEVKVTSEAHDGTQHVYDTDVVIDNFPPTVLEVQVYMKDDYSPLYNGDWVIVEPSFEVRSLYSYSSGYLSDDDANRIGVALALTEYVDQPPEIWLTGEWDDQVQWSSKDDGIVFTPCEWDDANLGTMPANFRHYQCYESNTGITGYYGDLRLNIEGEDLSGNILDSNPGTVAEPRDPQTGQFGAGYETGIDNSHAWQCRPTFTRVNPRLVTGSHGIEVDLPGYMLDWSFEGDCPAMHGFWMVGINAIGNPYFEVSIVNFLGDVVKRVPIPTPYHAGIEIPLPLGSASIAINQVGAGDHLWIGVNSFLRGPNSSSSSGAETGCPGATRDKIGTTSAFVDVVNYEGRRRRYDIIEDGTWYADEWSTPVDTCRFPKSGQLTDSQLYTLYADAIVYMDTLSIPDMRIQYQIYDVGGPPVPPSKYEITLTAPFNGSDLAEMEMERKAEVSEAVFQESGIEFGFALTRNPVSSEVVFQVSIPSHGHADLSLYDLSGREVQGILVGDMPAGVHSISVPLNLPAGVYLCMLRKGTDFAAEKLVIVR